MESVWRALSSPHRRQILDLLREGPLTTGQVSRQMPDLSRFAIMQHLQVLEDARLVLGRKEGRSRLNFSNPIPLREELGRWLNSHAMTAAESALHLRRYAESQMEAIQMNTFRTVKLEMEMVVRAVPELVYRAVVEDLDKWWPHRFKPDSTIVVDARPGGLIEERYVGGGGAVYGMIMQLDPGRKIGSSAPSAMNQTFYSYNVETFTEHPEGTLYTKQLTFFGEVPEETEAMFREGMKAITEQALTAYLENGQGYDKTGGRS